MIVSALNFAFFLFVRLSVSSSFDFRAFELSSV